MAKDSYHIPYGLNQSYADMMISLNSKDGTVGRVVPMIVVMSYVISTLLLMFILFKTFIGTMATPFQKVLFGILWTLLTIMFTNYDGTKRMNLQRVVTVFEYLPKRSRHIYTRTKYNAIPFYNIVGIKSIDDDGLVYYEDNTFGYWYRVVGSASILLFEADKDAIINRVDNFYRKWDIDSEITFITAKEPQKVYRQVACLKKRYENLQNDDADLRELAEDQFKILKEGVGHTFKSIHQYMLIRSKNLEALNVATSMLQSEVEKSTLMIKQCVPLEREEVIDFLATIYQKGDF